MKNDPTKRELTEEMRIELAQRSERLAHLMIQAECAIRPHLGRTYIVVRSMHDYPAPGAGNMIDMTDEIESFMWTGKPSANDIVSKALKEAAEEDERV
jgi:hypothetical protein